MIQIKNLLIKFVFQLTGKTSGFSLICADIVYSKWDPSFSIMLMLCGCGLEIVWLVPWETDESRIAKEQFKELGFYIDVEDNRSVEYLTD